MDESNQKPKFDENKQVPKADEPKAVPSSGEPKQMPWTNEAKPVPPPPKVPASATNYGPLRQSSSVASAEKEEPKPTPKPVESKAIPMPAPKANVTKQAPKQEARKVVKIPKRKFLIGSAIVVVVILLVLGVLSMMERPFGKGLVGNGPIMMDSSAPSATRVNGLDSLGNSLSKGSPELDYNRGYQQPPITDTREFMKINYSANIISRKVEDTVNSINNIVKGADGRVDSIYSSKKSGYVRFVVAQSKFESFKSQMENLTNVKLYAENVSSENLLGQKQGIEEQTGNIVNTLVNLNAQKATLNAKHAQTANYINVEIARIRTELASIRIAIAGATNNQALATLKARESSYVRQEATQLQLLSSENSSYAVKIQNLESSINNENNGLTEVNKQDSQFTDNIETVSGYVSVSWASLWEMARIFSPIPPILIVIILLIIIILLLNRYSRLPKVELE